MKASEREAFRLIEEMLSLMESRGLIELEMEQQGLRIRLRRGVAGGESPISGGEIPAKRQGVSTREPEAEEENRTIIKAPMVGTFYRAPAPDAAPFIDVGQRVEVGQVVCIIEAMKLMNELKSEVAGRVVAVLVDNGSPIEFGQSLFVVEAS